MRKLLVLLAVLATSLIAAGSAGAKDPPSDTWQLTLEVTTPIQVGGMVTLSGSLVHVVGNEQKKDVNNKAVTIDVYSGSQCEVGTSRKTYHPDKTDTNGLFSITDGPWVDTSSMTWSFYAQSEHGTHDCVTMTITSGGGSNGVNLLAPPHVDSVFLCYSASQTEPGVWPLSEAQSLYALGYWQPYAVPGNVEGGTNVGDYHLVCNLATGQSVGTGLVGGGGHVYGPGAVHDLGAYPIVQ